MTAGDLVGALAKAQGEFQPIIRAREGQSRGGRYKYAELADVLASVLPALSSNGLAVTQTLRPVDDWMALVTTLMHTGGGSIESLVPIVVDGNPQVFGSSMTYLRRYSLLAMLGVAAEDDDGQAAADQPPVEALPRKQSGTYQTETAPSGSMKPDIRNQHGNVIASCASYGQAIDYLEGVSDVAERSDLVSVNHDLVIRVADSQRAPRSLRTRAEALLNLVVDPVSDQE